MFATWRDIFRADWFTSEPEQLMIQFIQKLHHLFLCISSRTRNQSRPVMLSIRRYKASTNNPKPHLPVPIRRPDKKLNGIPRELRFIASSFNVRYPTRRVIRFLYNYSCCFHSFIRISSKVSSLWKEHR